LDCDRTLKVLVLVDFLHKFAKIWY
jgi:hypothetical protein